MYFAILKEAASTYSNALLNICFPDRCAGCKTAGALLCKKCQSALSRPKQSTENTKAITRYSHTPVRTLIWRLKYKRDTRVAHLFAPLIAKAIKECAVNIKPVVLVPVPISEKRRRTRGYNQATHIVRAIQNVDPKIFILSECLKKIHETKPQTACKNRRERVQNISESFVANIPPELVHLPFIVIDDVTTTGATLREAQRALKKSGVRSVDTWAIAR